MNVTPRRPDLGAELLGRARRDQDVREALVDPPAADQWEVVRCVDAGNSGWLEGIVDEHGWPGIGLVGEDGAHAAWLLVQHAPVRLQQRCLPLLHDAVAAADAAAVDLAYLDDRVRIRQQRPQRHGTQWMVRGGQQRLLPLEEPGQVNQRRAALGLPALASSDIADAWPASMFGATPGAHT